MLDINTLRFRSQILQKLRAFFTARAFIELDTPALSPELPPDTDYGLFRTQYDDPWTGSQKQVYLLPSHRYFLTKAVAGLKSPVFQLSKCYRNGELADRLTSPEFTFLEAYMPEATSDEAAALIEALFDSLIQDDGIVPARPPYRRLTLDEAGLEYAGFQPSKYNTVKKLAEKLVELGFTDSPSNSFRDWQKEELFELLLTQCIVPALPEDKCLFITDWPSFRTEQWRLYAAGTELAAAHSEKADKNTVSFTSIELYADRLIMLLAHLNSVENAIPFPFRLKKGYY